MDERIKAICQTLKDREVITDYCYDHFRQPEAVALPYARYRRVAGMDFSADGVNYYKRPGVDFEIFSANPDEMAEIMEQTEALLDEAEIYYDLTADTVYIESENYYETLYEI